jgi:formylglycine-generating enzyme required for sulfatase activity
VNAGASVTFTAAATGVPTPTYQWERSPDGTTWTPIAGATQASYIFTAQATDNGAQFHVKAANSVSTVTSNAATLTVNLTFQLPDTTNPGTTVPLVLKAIPTGTFLMGRYAGEAQSISAEDPQHSVTISQPFYMGQFEVTQAQWQAIKGNNPSHFCVAGGGAPTDDLTRPVETVSWDVITTPTTGFLAKLNAATAATRPAGMVFRLPTEAEWEWACRAQTTGTPTRFYWGDDPSDTDILNNAWFLDNSDGGTHPVGTKTANAFGLYDMSGNVWEWCEDDWHSDYTGAPTDGSAWVDNPRGTDRMLRGGCWYYNASNCRSAYRWNLVSGNWGYVIGFRVVLGLPRTP